MKLYNSNKPLKGGIEKIRAFSDDRQPKKIWLILLMVIYILFSVVVVAAARSDAVINAGGNVLPVSAFAGVFSALANLCMVMMVLYYKKQGLIISCTFLAISFPIYLNGLIATHNLTSIPGMFTGFFTIVSIVIIYLNHKKIETEKENLKRLFEQTAGSLVNAIDAKDKYTHGHSSRVAEYARMIAEMSGKNEKECNEIYYAGLLHDVGKIGIPLSVINKAGKLTYEEYDIIKQHPVTGAQILQTITDYPFLSIGAGYHHEHYDGKGYPDKLKGTDIPEIARIIAVADAYDAMTSKRSYRDPLPQLKVREEFVKCLGTQFDPEFARIMLHIIDMDTDYTLREQKEIEEFSGKNELIVEEYRSTVSKGILMTEYMTTIRLKVSRSSKHSDRLPKPALLLFDSLDARVYTDRKNIKILEYAEYGEIRFDGYADPETARKMQSVITENVTESLKDGEYIITSVRYKDHGLIRITGRERTAEVTIAFPDSSRYAYIGLTGEYCRFSDVTIDRAEQAITADHINRIADEISYINVPAGDVPNVQIDGFRTSESEGIPLKHGMQITFHAMSLPSARLVWHCPSVDIFTSDDGKVHGTNYRDFSLMRIDGESWEYNKAAENSVIVNKNDSFEGWDEWKKFCKDGFDCTVTFGFRNNTITAITENAGIFVKSVTKIKDGTEKFYISLTGDQVALTNIRVNYS